MPVIRAVFATALAAVLFALVDVPAADAAPKNHPSDNTPWLIGLAVVVVLVLALLFLRLRRGVTRDDGNPHFRE
jgi:hypothetical protein